MAISRVEARIVFSGREIAVDRREARLFVDRARTTARIEAEGAFDDERHLRVGCLEALEYGHAVIAPGMPVARRAEHLAEQEDLRGGRSLSVAHRPIRTS